MSRSTGGDFNSKVVKAYEEREAALIVENANVRQALALLSQELMDTINGVQPLGMETTVVGRHGQPLAESMQYVLDANGAGGGGGRSGGGGRGGGGGEVWLQQLEMPFDVVQTDIQLAIRDQLSALRSRMLHADSLRYPSRREMDRNGSESTSGLGGRGGGGGAVSKDGKDREIERLETELADARHALKEQERLVEAYLHHSSHIQPVCWEQEECGGRGGSGGGGGVPAAATITARGLTAWNSGLGRGEISPTTHSSNGRGVAGERSDRGVERVLSFSPTWPRTAPAPGPTAGPTVSSPIERSPPDAAAAGDLRSPAASEFVLGGVSGGSGGSGVRAAERGRPGNVVGGGGGNADTRKLQVHVMQLQQQWNALTMDKKNMEAVGASGV